VSRFLKWWVGCVLRRPLLVVAIACFVCGLSLFYTINYLGVNTDTTELLSPELPFHQERIRYWETFPQDVKAIVAAVEGATAEQTADAVRRFGDLLKAEADSVRSVYVPGAGRYFEQAALLYYDVDESQVLATRLSGAQPLISRLQQDNSLNQLLSITQQALGSDQAAVDIEPLLTALREAMQALMTGQSYQLSWQQMMTERRGRFGTTLRLVLIKPVFDYSRLLPAEKTLRAVRQAAEAVQQAMPGVTIRMTGEVPLEQDDMQSISRSATVAGVMSFILVCMSLLVGLRSVALMIAALATLIMGLVLTAGFAALAIGHLNMISIAFAVLYIGLGVDYAIHLCLRYAECMRGNSGRTEALIDSVKDVGPSIILCAITSAVAFYAFVPTSFSAVSELGIISGTSMFIALLVTLTVLPAILELMPQRGLRSRELSDIGGLAPWVYDIPVRHARLIRWCAVGLGIVAAVSLSRVTFDFNPVNLRDPSSESVVLFKELLQSKEASPMTLTVLASDEAAARALAERLEMLASVEKAITIHDLIPQRQDEKLNLIESLSTVLGPGLGEFPRPSQQQNGSGQLREFLQALDDAVKTGRPGAETDGLMTLRAQTEQFLRFLESRQAESQAELLNKLERNLLGTLPAAMRHLATALEATPVDVTDLPPELVVRWLSPNGSYRVQVFPKKDLDRIENLREFITDVQSVAPNVTDLPVIYLEAGREVVRAFQQALMSALVAVTVVLLLVLRNIKDTLHVLFPLVLAAMLTGAATVWLDIPVNFANIIALPLLFGLGVDSGIHMIHRLRGTVGAMGNVLHSSTARGVFFSALTTVFSFSSLAFTAHVGMASMGKMLAIGILCTLICTLIILPAFRRSGKPGLI
jgi:uncharacterized protein